MTKTNAMRILDKNKIKYEVIEYDISDGKIDGVSVAEKTNQDVKEVYKTLVTQGNTKTIYVFVIPVNEELNLKKAAKVCGEKKIDMIHVNDILKLTGYIRGGVSPIGQKREYKTFIHKDAESLERVCVSGGKKGLQVKLAPQDLQNVSNAIFEDLL